MTFPKGIRFRLLLWLSSLMLVAMVALSTFLYFSLRREIFDLVDSRLSEEVDEFRRLGPKNIADLVKFVARVNRRNQLTVGSKLYLRVVDESGKLMTASDLAKTAPLMSQEATRQALRGAKVTETVVGNYEHPIRCLAAPITLANGMHCVVQFGLSLHSGVGTLKYLIKNLGLAIAGFFLFSILVGWFLSRKIFNPLTAIIRTAKTISAENLEQRLQTTGAHDEFDELSETLNDMIARLEQAFKQIFQFAADISHELRTPLAVMKGEMEVALQFGKSEEDYRSVLMSSLEEIDRLVRIAGDLLLIARSEGRPKGRTFINLDLRPLLEQIHSDMLPLAKSRELDLTIGKMEEAYVWGDRDSLRRLFMNLVDNAIKYTPAGGKVSIEMERDGKSVKVSVSDTGIGIPAEDLPRIFERFFVAHKRRRGKESIGLGLSICRAVARMHGGDITVQSELKRGSRFTVTLPLIR